MGGRASASRQRRHCRAWAGIGSWFGALVAVGLVNRGVALAFDAITRQVPPRTRGAVALRLAGLTAVGVAINSVLLLVLPDVLDRIGFDASVAGLSTAIAGGVVLGVCFGLGFLVDEVELFAERGAGR